jgi:quercetin dioxygenase-like cupin family protein
VVPSYWFLDQLIDVLVDGRQTDGRYSLLEAHVPQGHQTPLHVHRDAAQAMYVLEGEQTVWVGDQVHTLARGDALDAPRGVPHTHKSTGTGPSRVLLLSIPAGLEGYICVAGTPGEERAQLDGTDMQRAATLALEHGIELLGPPGMLPAELPQSLSTTGQPWPPAR